MTDPMRPVAPREHELQNLDRALVHLPDAQICGVWPDGSTLLGAHIKNLIRELLAAASVPCAASPADSWQPIETAPKDRTIIGALIRDGKVWRVHEMKHNGLAFYTTAGGSLPRMTHWIPMPRATGEEARDGSDCVRLLDAHGLVRNLLARLPYPDRLHAPSVLVEEDGDLSFDWDEDRHATVSASLSSNGSVFFAALIGDWKAHGRFQLPAWDDTFNEAMVRLGEHDARLRGEATVRVEE